MFLTLNSPLCPLFKEAGGSWRSPASRGEAAIVINMEV